MNKTSRFLLTFLFLASTLVSMGEVSFVEAPSKTSTSDIIGWLHPRLNFSTEYDDNTFLEPTDEQDDFIFTTSPGLLILIPFDANTHVFSLDYQADIFAFAEFNDEDFIGHTLKTSLDLHFPKFHINTADIFKRTHLRADTEFTDRIDRYENTFDFKVATSDWNRLSLETGYNLFFTFYDSDALEVIDYYEHTVHGTAYYRLFTKTKALVEYDHAFYDYPDNDSRNGDADRVYVGLTGEPFTRLVTTAKVGYEDRGYDNDQGFSTVVVDLSATKYFTEGTAVGLGYQRGGKESTFFINNFYFTNAVSATLYQKLLWGLDGILSFSYANNTYDRAVTLGAVTAERDDDLYGVRAGVNYTIREWLNTGIDYFHYERASNFDTLDYSDNRVVWRISAKY